MHDPRFEVVLKLVIQHKFSEFMSFITMFKDFQIQAAKIHSNKP